MAYKAVVSNILSHRSSSNTVRRETSDTHRTRKRVYTDSNITYHCIAGSRVMHSVIQFGCRHHGTIVSELRRHVSRFVNLNTQMKTSYRNLLCIACDLFTVYKQCIRSFWLLRFYTSFSR